MLFSPHIAVTEAALLSSIFLNVRTVDGESNVNGSISAPTRYVFILSVILRTALSFQIQFLH